jgi:protein-S-isoprenylcysteine O-methyltransferase Ste14
MADTETGAASTSPFRIFPPILAGALFLATFLVHLAFPALRGFDLPLPVLGLVLVAAGTAVMVYAAAIFGARDTTKNPYGEPSEFVTRPPYTFTRNPMYLGATTILLGIAAFIGTLPMFIAPIVFFFTIDRLVIPHEEATMERRFGDAYREYKGRVRRWL